MTMDGYNGSRKAKAAQLAHWDPKNSQRNTAIYHGFACCASVLMN